MATAAEDGGGRRRRTMVACEIGRQTTTGKGESGWQTTTALGIERKRRCCLWRGSYIFCCEYNMSYGFLCGGGFANKRESCTYNSVYYLHRGKMTKNMHPQHHVFWGECFSSSVQMYAFLCGNTILVVFSKQRNSFH